MKGLIHTSKARVWLLGICLFIGRSTFTQDFLGEADPAILSGSPAISAPIEESEEATPSTRYYIDGQPLTYIPLRDNVVGVNGHEVPEDRPIGYRLRDGGGVTWVRRSSSRSPALPTQPILPISPPAQQPVVNNQPFESAVNKCIACHLEREESPRDREGILLALGRMSEERLKVMLGRRDYSEGEKNAIRDYSLRLRNISPIPPPPTPSHASRNSPPGGGLPDAAAPLQSSLASPLANSLSRSTRPLMSLTPEQQRVIRRYENEMRYVSGNLRYRFPPDTFRDVPQGGTGRLILAYFGSRREDLDRYIQARGLSDFVEARNYPMGSPEYQHARLFDTNALGLDGLGRKVVRYPWDPMAALQNLIQEELPALREYRNARLAQGRPFPTVSNQGVHTGSPSVPPRSVASPPLAQSLPTQPPPIQLPPAQPLARSVSPVATVPIPNPPHSPPSTELLGGSSPANVPSAPVDSAARTRVAHTMNQNCLQCHGPRSNGTSSATRFPPFLLNLNDFENRLAQRDSTAIRWLDLLNQNVVQGSMLENANLSRSQGNGLDFVRYIEGLRRSHGGSSEGHAAGSSLGTTPPRPRPAATAISPEQERAMMIDRSRRNEYLEVLRNANVPENIRNEILGFDLMWDQVGSPPHSFAPNGGDSNRRGYRAVNQVPADPVRPVLFEQQNGQWQWKEPFNSGFAIDSNTRGIEKFFFLRLPRDARGNPIPCANGTEHRTGIISNRGGYSYMGPAGQPTPEELPSPWVSCPVGTKVFEVLYTRAFGRPIPIDILSREKRITENGNQVTWVPDAFRQDSSPARIREWIARQPDAATNPDFQRLLNAINNPIPDAITSTLGRNNGGGAPFIINGQRTNQIRGSKSIVTGVSMETLRRLYTQIPMTSAAGSSGWQLEPQNLFSGSHRGIPVNSQTCANCHRMAGASFRNIMADAGLESEMSLVAQYGNGPGSDSILSLPGPSLATLRNYANTSRTDTGERVSRLYTLREELRPLFQSYNPNVHTRDRYLRSDWIRTEYPRPINPMQSRHRP